MVYKGATVFTTWFGWGDKCPKLGVWRDADSQPISSPMHNNIPIPLFIFFLAEKHSDSWSCTLRPPSLPTLKTFP